MVASQLLTGALLRPGNGWASILTDNCHLKMLGFIARAGEAKLAARFRIRLVNTLRRRNILWNKNIRLNLCDKAIGVPAPLRQV
jgi:hypothetical protein